MPHELCFDPDGNIYVAERDSHAVRKIDRAAGRSRRSPAPASRVLAATAARRRRPSSDPAQHRVRRQRRPADLRHRQPPNPPVGLATGIIDTYRRDRATEPTPDGAPLAGHAAERPAHDRGRAGRLAVPGAARGERDLPAGPGGRADRAPGGDRREGLHGRRRPGPEATLAGPKGLAYGPGGTLYIADTENHVIRAIDLRSGTISTVLGTGERGDGPGARPAACKLARPHGLWADRGGALYVADSEAHRIRLLGSDQEG